MYSRRLSMLECLFEKLACKLMEMKLSWAIDYSIAGCKNVYRSEAPSNHLNVFDKMLKPQKLSRIKTAIEGRKPGHNDSQKDTIINSYLQYFDDLLFKLFLSYCGSRFVSIQFTIV